jgi:purine-binding chemotaxis protein CheW
MNTLTTNPVHEVPGEETSQYCTFTVDGLHFGVSVSEVQEVLRHQRMTLVPQAPKVVRGLINLRGQIVTSVDMRSQLGLENDHSEPAMNVIVRSRDEVVSLLVDDIGDVIDIGDRALEPAPSTLPQRVREVIHGVMALPGSILLVLNPARAADVTVTSGILETSGENQ